MNDHLPRRMDDGEGHFNRGEKNPGILVLAVCSVNVI